MSSPAVWLITGTSSGFGRELTLALLKRGDKVIATARNVDKIKDLQELGAAVLQLDVTAPLAELNKVAEAAEAIYGRVDNLINNAGYVHSGTVEESSPEETYAQFNTNVFGLLNTTRAFLPYFRARKSGTIVMISSVAGQTSGPGASLYCASKWALEALAEGLAGEVAPLGIKTLIVEPGYFRTSLLSSGNQPHAKQVIKDYEPISTAISQGLSQMNGNQQGDPKLGVERIIELVTKTGLAQDKEIPLRVALGSDAARDIRAKCVGMLKDLDAWDDFSASTDFAK